MRPNPKYWTLHEYESHPDCLTDPNVSLSSMKKKCFQTDFKSKFSGVLYRTFSKGLSRSGFQFESLIFIMKTPISVVFIMWNKLRLILFVQLMSLVQGQTAFTKVVQKCVDPGLLNFLWRLILQLNFWMEWISIRLWLKEMIFNPEWSFLKPHWMKISKSNANYKWRCWNIINPGWNWNIFSTKRTVTRWLCDTICCSCTGYSFHWLQVSQHILPLNQVFWNKQSIKHRRIFDFHISMHWFV